MIQCGIGVGVGWGNGLSIEALKARNIPVAGAIVIAPLISTLYSYGIIRDSFIAVGSPSLAGEGVSLDGVDDALWIAPGYSAAFTLTAKVTQLTFGGGVVNGATVNAMSSRPGASGWYGWGYEQYGTSKYLLIAEIARIPAGAKDSNPHVVTIKRASNITTLYIDGTASATGAAGTTGGDGIVLGASHNTAFVDFMQCTIANVALFTSALSDSDRLAVEAWAQ